MIEIKNAATKNANHLSELIRDKIASQGKISFSQFMHFALYTPGLGYYSNDSIKFGAAGDFVTAPELGNLFALCLANQCYEVLAILPHKNIFEFGAGSGKLASDLLLAFSHLNIELDNYFILEVSATLRKRQQEVIAQRCPQYAHKVHWLDQLPSTPIDAIVIANEVLDAMPVSRFYFDNGILKECFVACLEENFVYQLDQPSPMLQSAFEQYGLSSYITNTYCSEINLYIDSWLKSLAECLNKGTIILCDYGFPRTEYYHPQRDTGTLMCHYHHRAHTDPFMHIGLQDITAHVDFTHVAEAAEACGLTIAGYTNQASFLLNCGLMQYLETNSIQHAHEINVLTSPAEMGELFKVMALSKNIDLDLVGFRQFDKTHCL
jgi:SAM-dependent MidA family methyltransferase